MQNHVVAIVPYEKPRESVRRAVDLADGFKHMPSGASVFIKPNIVFWTRAVTFPKWGVVTTSRVIEDVVHLLKEHGTDDIIIGEGMVTLHPKDRETPAHAFETLGYRTLVKRYGVKVVNIMERPFEKVDLGGGVRLNFNSDILGSDFVVDVPVMKTHNQTIVSLGIKNLKGMIDIPSRKKCHSADLKMDLHYMISHLANGMPPMLTVYDGIYTCERGPAFDGRMHRSNILMASTDVLAGDMVGAKVLGHDPADVPHLSHAAANCDRPTDLSDVTVVGESIEKVGRYHEYDFEYTEETGGSLPLPLAKNGIKGISYRKYDSTLCTYCSSVNGVILSAIRLAWKGEPFDEIEVLTGKKMQPKPGKKKTILLGKCMYQANKDHPNINKMIAVKSCPPKMEEIVRALHQAGIDADRGLFDNIDQLPGYFTARYRDKAEFDESLFRIE